MFVGRIVSWLNKWKLNFHLLLPGIRTYFSKQGKNLLYLYYLKAE